MEVIPHLSFKKQVDLEFYFAEAYFNLLYISIVILSNWKQNLIHTCCSLKSVIFWGGKKKNTHIALHTTLLITFYDLMGNVYKLW